MQHRSRWSAPVIAAGLALCLTARAESANPPTAVELLQSAPYSSFGFMASQSDQPWLSERWWQVMDAEVLPLLQGLREGEPLIEAILWWWQALVDLDPATPPGRGHAFVAYASGVLPVLQAAISNPERVRDLIARFELETGIRSRSYPLAGETLLAWELFPPGWPGMDLGIRIEPDRITLSVLVESENSKQQALRFGIGGSVRNLTDNTRWHPLLDRLRAGDAQIAAIDLAQLSATALAESATPLRRDIVSLFPEAASELPASGITPVCRQELLAILERLPDVTLAIVRDGGPDGHYQAEQILRIADPDLLSVLQSVPGTLPHYAVVDTGALFAMAAAINTDGLTELVLETATRLRQGNWRCAPIAGALAAQADSIKATGAGLMTASALVRALGLAAYPGDNGLPTVIASLHSGFPAQLAASLQLFFPEVFGNGIPRDELAPLTGLPALLPLSIGRRDDALVVAFGSSTALDLEQLLTEQTDGPATGKGLFATRFDYGAIGDSMLAALPEEGSGFPVTAAFSAMDAETCDIYVLAALQLRSLGLTGGARATIDARGLVDSGAWSLVDPPALPDRLAGDYSVSELTAGCRWSLVGEETIDASGNGRYSGFDSTGTCLTDELDYRWTRSGHRFEQQQTGSRYRDDCTAEWIEDTLVDEVCLLKPGMAEDDFFCLYPGDDEPVLLRYQSNS